MYAGGAFVCVQWLLADIEVEVQIEEEASEHGIHADYDQTGDSEQQGLQPGEEGRDGQVVPVEEEFEGDEDAICIPLTIAKKMPREYYKGSDPEWHEFRKWAADKDQMQKVYSKFTFGLLRHVAHIPQNNFVHK